MKYSIQINQKAIFENSKELDIIDAAILDYLIHFCSSDDKKVKQMNFTEEGTTYRYTWINYSHLIEEMPLLPINTKSAIGERIKKIEKAGYIKAFRAPDNTIYIRLTENCKLLFFERRNASLTGVFSQENGSVHVGLQHKQSNQEQSNITANADISLDYLEDSGSQRELRQAEARKKGVLPRQFVEKCIDLYVEEAEGCDFKVSRPDFPKTVVLIKRVFKAHEAKTEEEMWKAWTEHLTTLFQTRGSPFWERKKSPTISAVTSEDSINWALNN